VPETTEAYEDLRGISPGAPVGMLESGTPGEPEGYELVISNGPQAIYSSVDVFCRLATSWKYFECRFESSPSSANVKEVPCLDLAFGESMTGLRWGRYMMW